MLRPAHTNGGDGALHSDLDGYLSEGGASLYAHKINQRFKEGIRQVQESMSKVQQYMHDDRSVTLLLPSCLSCCRLFFYSLFLSSDKFGSILASLVLFYKCYYLHVIIVECNGTVFRLAFYSLFK